MTLTLFGFPPSTYTQSARLLCGEVGANYELQGLEFHQPSHFALHPFGKMPVLQHDDITVYETLAIAVYLDDVFNDGSLQPTNAAARARMFQWISSAIDYGYPSLVSAMHDESPTPEAIAGAGSTLSVLNVSCSNRFLVGATVTLADFVLYPMVGFVFEKLGEAPSGLTSLNAWYERMSERMQKVAR
ncbi:MAG: glutathione S-transferase family protein [Myxococcota bacterium]